MTGIRRIFCECKGRRTARNYKDKGKKGADMGSGTAIVCYGCTEEQISIIRENLPLENMEVVEAESAADVIAFTGFMVIIDPEALNAGDIRMLAHYFLEEDEVMPVLTAKCPFFEDKNVFYRLLDAEHFKSDIKCRILEYYKAGKEAEEYRQRLRESFMIVREIIHKPYVSTEALAHEIGRSRRTVLRNIHILNRAGEWIGYSEKHDGWYVPTGKSILLGNVIGSSSAEDDEGECRDLPFTLSHPERSWNAWYGAAIAFSNKWIRSDDPEDGYRLVWYTIAEEITRSLEDEAPAEIAFSIISDMMLKLTGSNEKALMIMTDNMEHTAGFSEIMSKYNLKSNCYDTGFEWTKLCSSLSSGEFPVLANEALPFWCWLKPYTDRYTECWLTKNGHSEWFNLFRTGSNFSEDYEDAVRELIDMYPSLSLDALTQTDLISSVQGLGYRDIEGLFFLLLGRGVQWEDAYKLAHRIGHNMEMRKELLSGLQKYFTEDEMKYLLSGEHVPPRAIGIRKLLKTVDLTEA
jgi:biotin operon repressor